MRTAVRLILLCVSLTLLACAARAQPARHSARDARCKAAANRFISVISDKAHRTVEYQSRVTYNEGRKYLSRCGDLDDNFTRSVKDAVENHEAARRCVEMRDALSRLVREGMSGYGEEHGKHIYEASEKFLRVCGGKDERFDAFIRNWVEKYDKAVREFEEKRKAEESPAKDPTREQ
jgi:hypothetical protein